MNLSDRHVVLCCDSRYALGCWTTLWSCHENLGHRAGSVVYHLLCPDPAAPPLRRLLGLADRHSIRLECHPVTTASFRDLPQTKRLPKETYLRLLAPGLLAQLDAFLYLDTDLLVRDSIWPLLEQPVGPGVVAGSLDYCHGRWDHGGGGGAFAPRGGPYVNCGVLAIDARAWRERGVSARCIEWLLHNADQVHHGDQDGINAVLGRECRVLDPEWNVQVGAFDYLDRTGWPGTHESLRTQRDSLLRDGRIIHFIGPAKPWQDGLLMPFAGEYRRKVVQSGWLPPGAGWLWRAGVGVRAICRAAGRRLRRLRGR